MSCRLLNKVCVITGAASGIGQAIAELFAKNGAKLVLIDISDCKETISKINNGNNERKNILCIKCDISSESSVISASKSIQEKYGFVDVLINNAARFIFHSVLTASNNDWNDSLSVNIKGHALMIKHIVPIMKKGGSIVMMCSISSFIAQPKCVTYSVTKAAMLQMTRNSALDLWNDHKIRVNAVCPGTILTAASFKEMKAKNLTLEEWEKMKCKEQIIKNVGNVRDVAFAALFFASNESKFCTGSALMVDGGHTAL